MRSIRLFLFLKICLLVIAVACAGSICVACSGGAEPQAESAGGADAPEEQAPFGGLSDEEILGVAKDQVENMHFQVRGMIEGALFEQAWTGAIEDGSTYYPVTEVSTMQELEDRWYQLFSTRYTIEDAINGERGYREFNGALYTKNAGVGSVDLVYDIQEIANKTDDEVEFTGATTNERDSLQIKFTMSLVYENGQWKYGVWRTGSTAEVAKVSEGSTLNSLEAEVATAVVQEGSTASEGSGSADGESSDSCENSDQQSSVSSDTASWTSEDYFNYLLNELTEKGHYWSWQSAVVEKDEATSMTVAVGDDSPEKWTVTGRYTIDKGSLAIYDETFGEYI